jgi:hypothetical protein
MARKTRSSAGTPTIAAPPPPLMAIYGMGRRVRFLSEQDDKFDAMRAQFAPGSDGSRDAIASGELAYVERAALLDLILATRAETLADVAVQGAACLHIVDELDGWVLTEDEIRGYLQQLRRAMASITIVASKMSDIEIDTFGPTDTKDICGRQFPSEGI